MRKEISQLIMIEVKPGQRDEQIKAYSKLAPLVLAERGCLKYDLKAIEGNENKFVLLEKWTSKEALEFHDNTDYMKKADSSNHIFRAKPAKVITLIGV